MGFIHALSCCVCGGLGLLLVAAVALPQVDEVAGTDDVAGTDGAKPAAAILPETTLPETALPETALPGIPGIGVPGTIPPAVSPPAVSPPTTSPSEPEQPQPPSAAGNGPCLTEQACIDQYLWSLYQRAPKIDTVTVPAETKVTVKHKGKVRTVTRKGTKLVSENFAWKDTKAAEVAGMALIDYVIGGMDPEFRTKLYRALHTLDDAGFKPGIMCAFRDDYRQSIATGWKAQNDRSFHGGSFRGGYGHGLAADIISVKGDTAAERSDASGKMWDWIDKHEKELGIGRPYLNRDPPHVAPVDGEEYADHRLKPKLQHAQKAKPQHADKKVQHAAKSKLQHAEKLQHPEKTGSANAGPIAARHDPGALKRTTVKETKSSKSQARGRMPAI